MESQIVPELLDDQNQGQLLGWIQGESQININVPEEINEYVIGTDQVKRVDFLSNVLHGLLRHLYIFGDGRGINLLLNQFPEAEDRLIKAHTQLRHIFASEELHLEFVQDPDGEFEDELSVYIYTSDEPEVALKKLDEFDAVWLSDPANAEYDLISFNLSYL